MMFSLADMFSILIDAVGDIRDEDWGKNIADDLRSIKKTLDKLKQNPPSKATEVNRELYQIHSSLYAIFTKQLNSANPNAQSLMNELLNTSRNLIMAREKKVELQPNDQAKLDKLKKDEADAQSYAKKALTSLAQELAKKPASSSKQKEALLDRLTKLFTYLQYIATFFGNENTCNIEYSLSIAQAIIQNSFIGYSQILKLRTDEKLSQYFTKAKDAISSNNIGALYDVNEKTYEKINTGKSFSSRSDWFILLFKPFHSIARKQHGLPKPSEPTTPVLPTSSAPTQLSTAAKAIPGRAPKSRKNTDPITISIIKIFNPISLDLIAEFKSEQVHEAEMILSSLNRLSNPTFIDVKSNRHSAVIKNTEITAIDSKHYVDIAESYDQLCQDLLTHAKQNRASDKQSTEIEDLSDVLILESNTKTAEEKDDNGQKEKHRNIRDSISDIGHLERFAKICCLLGYLFGNLKNIGKTDHSYLRRLLTDLNEATHNNSNVLIGSKHIYLQANSWLLFKDPIFIEFDLNFNGIVDTFTDLHDSIGPMTSYDQRFQDIMEEMGRMLLQEDKNVINLKQQLHQKLFFSVNNAKVNQFLTHIILLACINKYISTSNKEFKFASDKLGLTREKFASLLSETTTPVSKESLEEAFQLICKFINNSPALEAEARTTPITPAGFSKPTAAKGFASTITLGSNRGRFDPHDKAPTTAESALPPLPTAGLARVVTPLKPPASVEIQNDLKGEKLAPGYDYIPAPKP